MSKLYDSAFGIYCGCIYQTLSLKEKREVRDYLIETIIGEDNTVSGLRCPKCGAHWAIHEV
jgi:hypothetical protein